MNMRFSARSTDLCFKGSMMKRIMNPGVAAVAFAASALFAAPASADPIAQAQARAIEEIEAKASGDLRSDHRADHRDWRRDSGGRYGRYDRLNRFGQTRWEEAGLRRDAIRACQYDVDRFAHRYGFYDVDYRDDVDERDVYQYSRYGFSVSFYHVEFEGRHRDFERTLLCEVDRGRVVRLDGLPVWRGTGRGRGYWDETRHDGWRQENHDGGDHDVDRWPEDDDLQGGPGDGKGRGKGHGHDD
jgi:hypothetical protein